MARRRAPRAVTPVPTSETQVGTDRDDVLGGNFEVPQILSGLGGDDYIRGRSKADRLDGGDGDDYIQDGDNAGVGAGANDILIGGAGRDSLFSENGVDRIDGGAGNDFALVRLTSAVAGVTVTGALGQTMTFSNGTAIVDVERLSLSLGAGDDTVSLRTPGPTLVDGLAFILTLDTGAGNDTVTTGDARDSVNGGAGNDVISTGGDNDWLSGDGGNDRLEGGAGSDQLIGGEGDDVLDGGAGSDVLYGDSGNDIIVGGADADVFTFIGQGGVDRILDFDSTEGDQIVTGFVQEILFEDVVVRVSDPIGSGAVTVTDTADGVLIGTALGQGGSLLLVGLTTADLAPDFLI